MPLGQHTAFTAAHLTGTHRGSFSVLRLYLWTEYCLLLAPTYRHPQTFFLCPAPVPLDRTPPFIGSSLQAPTDVISLSCACTFGQKTAFYWLQPTGTHRRSFSVLRLYLWTKQGLLPAPAYRHPQTFFLCPAPVPLDRTPPFTGPIQQVPTVVPSLS